MRRAFTLVELLITVSIIGIMAMMMLFALWGAQESAKAQKTRSLIAKLDGIIKAKWEAYETRRVPIASLPDEPYTDTNGNGRHETTETYTDTNGNGAWDSGAARTRRARLDGLRDLMRMELPDHWTDVNDNPYTAVVRPAVNEGYRRRYAAASAPTGQYEDAECLYLIVTAAMSEDADGADVFRPDDSADTDDDGLREFIDGWKRPIGFLRWPAGFQDSELQIVARATANGAASGTVTLAGAGLNNAAGAYVGGAIFKLSSVTATPAWSDALDGNNSARVTGWTPASTTLNYKFEKGTLVSSIALMAPDPFDPSGVYVDPGTGSAPSFATYPLIFSAGPDGGWGVLSNFSNGINPFILNADGHMMGTEREFTGEPPTPWVDNIHNHLLQSK